MRHFRLNSWPYAAWLFYGLSFIRLGLLPVAAADNWQTGAGGNSARNCRSAEQGPILPRVLWQGSVSAVVAQQASIDGDIVVMPRMFNIGDTLHGTFIVAQNLKTGAQLWTKDLPVSFANSWRNRASAIRDGRVYATRSGNTAEEYLYALDQTNGNILWKSQDTILEETTESLAFADDGDPVAGNFDSVIRINATDGTTVWETARASPTSNGSQVAVYGNRVYTWEASASGPKILALDLTTGARLYATPGIGGGFIEQIGPLVGPDGTIYAPRSQNNVVTDFFVAFTDTGTGFVEKWRVPMGYVPFATFGVGPDGSVYTYTVNHEIIRLNPTTGAIVNTSAPIVSDFHQPRMAIDAAGRLFVTNGGFSQGALLSYNADLTPRWNVSIPNVNVGGPALGQDGILIVCGTGTNVKAFQTLLGDLNCDGVVDFFDIDPFILALNDPTAYGMLYPNCDRNLADINGDGEIDFFDIDPFIALLLG